MFGSYSENDLWLSTMKTLVGNDADLESARIAFDSTRGDFAARFRAAVEALVARLVRPEIFIDIPEHPERLNKAELEALVRPAAEGFLRSHPTKDELLGQVDLIKQRQEHRPPWIPRIDRDGQPMPRAGGLPPSDEETPPRQVVVSAFAELGDVTIPLPADTEERPELAMAPGGIGELEVVVHTVLGLVRGDYGPSDVTPIDATANEALVPDGVRWWSPDQPRPLPPSEDPGVASELLATTDTLAGLQVADNTTDDYDTVAIALQSAGDWRHSPRWLLDTWDPGDDAAVLATARASVAAWAEEGRSGLIVYVHGGALHRTEGLFASPSPLHSYLLCATRSDDGTDAMTAVRRVVLSCPGEGWCHRGGCPEPEFHEAAALVTPVIADADTAQVVDGRSGWAGETYDQLYRAGQDHDYEEDVLEYLSAMLSGAGWMDLERSTWEGGMEELLLRRRDHCLTASYDPVTRQIQLRDGKSSLGLTLELMRGEGAITGSDSEEAVDTSDGAVEQWGPDLITAAQDLLRGRIRDLPSLAAPLQATILGLHPHGDGALRAPRSASLAEAQLRTLLRTGGVFDDAQLDR